MCFKLWVGGWDIEVGENVFDVVCNMLVDICW